MSRRLNRMIHRVLISSRRVSENPNVCEAPPRAPDRPHLHGFVVWWLHGFAALLFTGSFIDMAYAVDPSVAAPLEHERVLTGTTSSTTEPFTVRDGWEVHWETSSASFKLLAYGVAHSLHDGAVTHQEQIVRAFEAYRPIVLANSSEPSGSAYHPIGGQFSLKIVANGEWTIRLIPITRDKDYLDVPYTGAP